MRPVSVQSSLQFPRTAASSLLLTTRGLQIPLPLFPPRSQRTARAPVCGLPPRHLEAHTGVAIVGPKSSCSRALALLGWHLPLVFLARLWQLGTRLEVAREHPRRRWNGVSRLKPSGLAQ